MLALFSTYNLRFVSLLLASLCSLPRSSAQIEVCSAVPFFHGSSVEGRRVEEMLSKRQIGFTQVGGGLSSRINVAVNRWEEARLGAESIGITVSAGEPLQGFRFFCRNEFDETINHCVDDLSNIEGTIATPLHFELIDQSRRQLSTRKSARLPSVKEWTDLKNILPRESQIRRLIALMPLSTAVIKEGRIIPVATLVPSNEQRLAVTEEKEIDPLVELVAMKLTPAECELLAPGMTYDWLLVPKNAEVAPFGVSVIRPCTRDFLCQLICNACGRAELIHLNSLSRDEWRDEAKVRSLLATAVQMP